MSTFPWTIYIILLVAGFLSALAVMPYALSFNAQALQNLQKPGPDGKPGRRIPLPVLILSGALQTTLLIALAAFVGLLAARQVGLDLPILRAALNGQPVGGQIAALLPLTLLLALATWAVMIALEAGYFVPRIPRALASLDARNAFWKRVLACFYGGIVEEILLRLFMMSGLTWLLSLVWQSASGGPGPGAYWTANILSALLFGAGHLPATRALTRLTPVVVARGLVLNGIPGVALGYLYMRFGLEAAMLAHFSLDILIHLVMVPLMAKRLAGLPAEAEPVSEASV